MAFIERSESLEVPELILAPGTSQVGDAGEKRWFKWRVKVGGVNDLAGDKNPMILGDFRCFFVVGHWFSLMLMWIRDISWCLEVLDGRSVMFFFGRQENNADIDDGKDVAKDVSAESAEDSQQNLHVCLLGKLFPNSTMQVLFIFGRKQH